jgi:hypothetical protein
LNYPDRLKKRVEELKRWKEENKKDLLVSEAVAVDILEALYEIYCLLDRK